jgi:ADP-heptose:LPS heptosyltransferase
MYCLDSGVAHLVSFLGKKSVVFYGSSDYRYTKPLFNSIPLYTEKYSNYLKREVSHIESLNNPNNLNLAPKFDNNSMYLGISLCLKKLIL